MVSSSVSSTITLLPVIKLVAVLILSSSTNFQVEACNGGHFRFGSYGSHVDYSHLDGLDASKHPTLSEKIRAVVSTHYGWGGGGSSHSHSHAGGGVSYSHTAGGGGHGHSHSSYSPVSSGHGWEHSHHDQDDHGKPGYQFAAHNHQKPVVVSPDKRNIVNFIRSRKLRKIVVKQDPKSNEIMTSTSK